MGDLVLPNPAYSFAAHASMLTHCMVECQAESNFFRHLEIMPVIPSLRSRASSERSEGSLRQAREILRYAQDDSQIPSQVRSRGTYLQMSSQPPRSLTNPFGFRILTTDES